MNKFQSYVLDPHNRLWFQKASLGVEREDHRITPDGSLAQTVHPTTVDSTRANHIIQRDFAESQLELVTPPVYSVSELMDWLDSIHRVALRHLENDERMWPYSMPPVIHSEDEINLASFGDSEAAGSYRSYLAEVYGKKLQTISGLHFNFGLHAKFIEQAYHALQPEQTQKEFQDDLYLKMARNILKYQWLIVYLFGNSPLTDQSFYREATDGFDHPVRSIRNSRYGYHNSMDVRISYDSLEAYHNSLSENIEAGRLSAEMENYASVRLRGGKDSKALIENGIKYIEMRMFDIQGESFTGITAEQVAFMKYFALYMLYMAEDASDSEVQEGMRRAIVVAEEMATTHTAFEAEGVQILEGMMDFVNALEADTELVRIVTEMLERMTHPELTPAAQTLEDAPNVEAWLEKGEGLAEEFLAEATARPYGLEAFHDMELSTQLLIADAVAQGIDIEILDRQDQFLRLTYKGHQEYVRQGNITSKDSYISHYLQADKTVTKQLLAENGFVVPESSILNRDEPREAVINYFVGQPTVVKPKSTNYGIGISIFTDEPTADELNAAIDEAFESDDSVLLERYVSGTEYRFFVMNDKVLAVLNRVPATVVGDGEHTISALIDQKNDSPLRGESHYTPLTLIEKGKTEQETLKRQGVTLETVLPKGERVRLRDNSNISTGGTSIDVTDDMDESYLDIAREATSALGVAITGLDIIITDRHQPANAKYGETNYAIIESNFNPMMMMHMYPEEGKGRPLTKALLAFLFPEKGMTVE